MSKLASSTRTSVFEPLVERLRHEIKSEKRKPGTLLGTEIALAKDAKISRSSAREAVSILVEEGLVERRAGKGVYVTNTRSTLIVELIIPNLSSPWTEVAYGAQAVGREKGIKIQLFNANGDLKTDVEGVRRLDLNKVDGAIIVSPHQRLLSEAVIELHQKGFPLVVIDQQFQDVDIPSVIFDNYRAGYLAGSELLRQGHRRIGFLGYDQGGTISARLEGLRDAVNDAGHPFDRSLVEKIPVESLLQRGEADLKTSLEKLLLRNDRPSAMFFHHENLARKSAEIIRSMSLRIPEELSFVTVGQESPDNNQPPALSTIALPHQEMGRVALETLIQKIRFPETKIETIVLPVLWIPGATIAAPHHS